MQDRAIAAIGKWQLEQKKDLEEVDLYVENMFPGKDWQILLLVFEITGAHDDLRCIYKGIDIENVRADDEGYRKYAYRKGSARGGDITFTTKLGFPVDKKLKTIKEATFKKVLALKDVNPVEGGYFEVIKRAFIENGNNIKSELETLFNNFEEKQSVTTGLSFKIIIDNKDHYLRDFELIKRIIIGSGAEVNFIHAGTESKTKNKISSVSGLEKEDIFGFAAPFKYSSPDKPGFIAGFFNKKKNWRNYPISADETLVLEIGRKFIQQNLTGYFYGHEYMMIPHPILKTDKESLKRVINLLKTAFDEEKKAKKEKKRIAEDRIQKLIANEKNFFNLDILFYKEDKKTRAITIELMLEEVLPSRFRELFIDVPAILNRNRLFKNAIIIKKHQQGLTFNYGIVKEIFDIKFLDVVNKLFLGNKLSGDFVFENIMTLIRKKYNDSKTKDGFVEPVHWIVFKAILVLQYLQELKIITNNKNYNYMETENHQKTEKSFNLERFNEFVKENSSFLDSDIKVGIFAVGVLVRFLFDIQQASLHNTPFEGKLRGYKLNPELLMNIYTEALDKIQKYKSFYAYQELREIISKYFVVNWGELKGLSNNELSFYFVAGLELGMEFKKKD